MLKLANTLFVCVFVANLKIFIQKVFVTKILLSGKFSLFLTWHSIGQHTSCAFPDDVLHCLSLVIIKSDHHMYERLHCRNHICGLIGFNDIVTWYFACIPRSFSFYLHITALLHIIIDWYFVPPGPFPSSLCPQSSWEPWFTSSGVEDPLQGHI